MFGRIKGLVRSLDREIFIRRSLLGEPSGGYEHFCSPSFDWKKYKHVYSPYFLKWNLRVPMCESMYFASVNGIHADYYVTYRMALDFIYPYLNRYQFIPAYHDKSIMRFLPLLVKGVRVPRLIVECSNGIFYDENRNPITSDSANSLLMNEEGAVIVKPSLGAGSGRGVRMVSPSRDGVDVLSLANEYKKNFIVQVKVCQHPDMATFNESSFNTVRVVTRRYKDGFVRMLYAVVRYGGSGAVCDNACAGGGFVAVDESGALKNRVAYHFQKEPGRLSDSVVNVIPSFRRILKCAIEMHEKLPHFDQIGWDIGVDVDGVPVMIEYNIRHDTGFQQATGPMYTRDELDELMDHIFRKSAFGHSIQPYSAGRWETWQCSSWT